MTAAPTATQSRSPLQVRDFRLLWAGETVSALGDQFALVALPWLALLLTGSSFALGTVLALMAVPRAVLMIVGGVFVDRFSPRLVMLVSNAVRFVAVLALGVTVLSGAAQLWMLYVFALVFGIADAFFYPANTAIVPDLVDGDQLQKANGIVQGTAQLTVLVGPALAGITLAWLGSSGSADLRSVGVALVIDALTFLASIAALALITKRKAHATGESGMLGQIGQGVRFVLKGPALRIVMLLSMCANLLIVGPFEVGLPYLAYTRLPEGATAFGLILSAFGGGSLVGMILASVLPGFPARHFGTIALSMLATTGLGVAGLAFTDSTVVVVALSAFIGVVLGYTNLLFITWVQRRIPRALMGRVMSLLIFSSVALVPISIAIVGATATASLTATMVVAGLGMSAVSLLALASRSVRQMGLVPIIEQEPAVEVGAMAAESPTAQVAPVG
jgi:Na+/melibiose symporter-like transporter